MQLTSLPSRITGQEDPLVNQSRREFLRTAITLSAKMTTTALVGGHLFRGLSRAQNLDPIKVGVLHSLTGTMAVSGHSLVDSLMMAIDEINQRGGVLGRPLLPIVEDGASDPPTFIRKAKKLILQDQVSSVFGCWTSASRKAVLPVFEQEQNLLWYPVQYEGLESSPSIMYGGAAPNQQIIPGVDWCLKHIGSRVYMVGSDYIFPRTANRLIKVLLRNRGASFVGEDFRPLGDTRFTEVVTRIQAAKPDVLINTINGDSNRHLFAALKAAGITSQNLPVMSFSIAEEEIREIGVDLTSGHYCTWSYFQSIATRRNQRFVRSFKKRYGETRVTDDPIESSYVQVHLFALALERAKSTKIENIREAARGLIFEAPGGLVRIDPANQHTWKVARVGQIQANGQFAIRWSSKEPIKPEPFPSILGLNA